MSNNTGKTTLKGNLSRAIKESKKKIREEKVELKNLEALYEHLYKKDS